MDHTNLLKRLREDVLVRKSQEVGVAPSPSPSASTASNSSAVVVVENEDIVQSDSDDSVDSEFYDSDVNVEKGDDDLFAENIDKTMMDYNQKELCEENKDEEALEDDDLDMGEGDMELLKKRIKPLMQRLTWTVWNEVQWS
jgi:hypothetical protein